jgi:hypothetical protein
MFSGKPEVFCSAERCIEDRFSEIEEENSRLQRLVAELLLQNQLLRNAHLSRQQYSGTFIQDRNRPHSG